MKRLDIVVPSNVTDDVVKSIKKVGIGGLTVLNAQGQGSAEEPLVGQYYSRNIIISVVEDEKVESIMKAVADVACTGTKGDGKIFISDIEEIMDICSKECGHTVL